MSSPIIVGVALRDDDAAPLALARSLAALTGAPLALVTTQASGGAPLLAGPERGLATRQRAEAAVQALAARHVPEHEVSVHVRDHGSVSGTLHDVALELDAAAIVVGSCHRGPIGRVLAGDVAVSLLHGAPCPVAVAPRGYRGRPEGLRRVGVAFVDTPEGREALAAGVSLAKRSRGFLATYTAADPMPWSPIVGRSGGTSSSTDQERRRHAEEQAKAADRRIPYGMKASSQVVAGAPAAALVEASKRIDLLVCGSRGYGSLRSVLLGSVSRALARSSACPLLVLPRLSGDSFPQLTHEHGGGIAAPTDKVLR